MGHLMLKIDSKMEHIYSIPNSKTTRYREKRTLDMMQTGTPNSTFCNLRFERIIKGDL
jgi:hypothetical protein